MNQIVIVSALFPELSLGIIDRYLIACETVEVEPLIVLNKIDLLTTTSRTDVKRQMSVYRRGGYRFAGGATHTGEGMRPFWVALAGRTNIFAIFAGQSRGGIETAQCDAGAGPRENFG